MRLIVMFDLPTETSKDRRSYRQFRKDLIKEGFYMMQYSVYGKVCTSRQAATFANNRIAAVAPKHGLVQSLMVTEKQYQSMEFITGHNEYDVIKSNQRTIAL